MKKVTLYENRCIGCGACISIAPNNFSFDDDGISKLISDEITNEAIEASECCPVSAIEIVETNCNCNDECNCDDNCHCNESHCEGNCNCKNN